MSKLALILVYILLAEAEVSCSVECILIDLLI